MRLPEHLFSLGRLKGSKNAFIAHCVRGVKAFYLVQFGAYTSAG
jgi:hypothetical protein